jgi:hypothetical protein
MLRVLGIALGLALIHVPVSGALAADQDAAVSGKRIVVKHRYHHRARIYGCPDGYGCYPLYGAYGPYGGRAYWSSFSYLLPSYGPRP